MLKTHVGEDWLRGRLMNGNEGIFPKRYVEIVVSVITMDLVYSLHVVHFCFPLFEVDYANKSFKSYKAYMHAHKE